jgi:hypothetical protein
MLAVRLTAVVVVVVVAAAAEVVTRQVRKRNEDGPTLRQAWLTGWLAIHHQWTVVSLAWGSNYT